MTPVRWFKVLVGGKSCHGGSLDWSLPKDGNPGDWHEVDGVIQTCSRGLHLTTKPAEWYPEGATVYLAEGEDPASADGNKAAFRRARLTKELTADELVEVNIFLDRSGEAREGLAIARGNSTVVARGNSTVEARGNSTVEAWENSTVEARGNSTVVARGNSTVEAWGNSTVVAWENSTVEAWGNSTVVAWGNSTVEGSGMSTTVRAKPDCGCGACRNGSTCTVKERAVLIDQTGDAPKVTTAAGELIAPTTKKPKATKKRLAKRAAKKVRK